MFTYSQGAIDKKLQACSYLSHTNQNSNFGTISIFADTASGRPLGQMPLRLETMRGLQSTEQQLDLRIPKSSNPPETPQFLGQECSVSTITTLPYPCVSSGSGAHLCKLERYVWPQLG